MDNDDQFRARVARLEHRSRHEPRRFSGVTVAMAVLGQAAIFLALALAIAALWWAVSGVAGTRLAVLRAFVAVGSISLLGSLGQVLLARTPSPSGHSLQRSDAPRLFALIDEVGKRCSVAAPDVVLLDPELNAAVVQQPRLGLLGCYRNTLILGLPLMMALDTRQLAGVVAHEFGHLKGAHGKLGAWIYRTRRSWFDLATTRERARFGGWFGGWFDGALSVFFNVYFPIFNAHAFVLARQQEYEADRTAHRVTSARHCAQGLVAMTLQARYLEECFWPEVFRAASSAAIPTAAPYAAMVTALRRALTHPDAAQWLRDGMKSLPRPTDTHPSLRERLEFAGVKPGIPAPPQVSAAEALLGASLATWIGRMDSQWRGDIAEGWATRHRFLQREQRLIDEFVVERRRAPLSAQDHLVWASAARATGGAAAEIPVLRQLLADHPDHAQGRHELGTSLLQENDLVLQEEGAALLRAVAEASLSTEAAASARSYESWLERTERFAELKTWRPRRADIEARSGAAWDALHDFEDRPRFDAHGLGPRCRSSLIELLRREPAVGRAFVVCKTAIAAPGWQLLVLIVERARGGVQPDPETWWEALRARVDLPGPFMVIDLAHPFWKDDAQAALVRQMTQVRGALVHERHSRR